jgi:hypothetical protein
MAKLVDLDGLAYFYSKIKAMLAEKLGKNDTAVNAAKVNGLTVETAVPKNAKFTDTVYEHPSTHPASMITGLAAVATSGSYNDLTDKPNIPASITIDSELSTTSTNPVQNKVVKTAIDTVTASIPTKVSDLPNDAGYLTQHQSLADYAKTSVANTWTAQQIFQQARLAYERYFSPKLGGTSIMPQTSVIHCIATGEVTLNLNHFSTTLEDGDSTVFTAYIESSADYPLTITNAGTIKYIGSASDVAITSAGLLLNILMMKDASDTVTSIVQASKLS